jgi:hypothetical protein
MPSSGERDAPEGQSGQFVYTCVLFTDILDISRLT